MFLLAALSIMGLSQTGIAAEFPPDASDAEMTQQGRQELRDFLLRENLIQSIELLSSGRGERKPAVLGAATAEPSERREMYLDYSDSIPETSVESVSE